MSTKTPNRPTPANRQHPPTRRRGAVAALREDQAHRTRRRYLVGALALAAVAGVVTAMMLSSSPTSSNAARRAPAFTMTTTAGTQVSLADFRGHNVLLYFSEGAGCGACLQQMAAIEKDKATFAKADVTVLPIVMNTRDQITRDMSTYGVKTPFLLDKGTASKAYGALGNGMHDGLPGHSFVLIDAKGMQRWFGDYPSMWLTPSDLLTQVSKQLAS